MKVEDQLPLPRTPRKQNNAWFSWKAVVALDPVVVISSVVFPAGTENFHNLVEPASRQEALEIALQESSMLLD